MTDIPFPLVTAPGLKPQAGGGRVINCYPEKLAGHPAKPHAWFRVPGLGVWGTAPSGRFRGGVQVGNFFYGVFGTTVYSWTSSGGAGTSLTGSVPGTGPVFCARNNAATPDIVFVSPGDGAFHTTGAAVASYPDPDVGQPNSVVFHKGFFIFTYGDGSTMASGVNLTSIATTDVATAESKPDTLYRPIPLGNGQLLLCGSSSIEVWGGNVNDTGYPFNYIATIPRGIVGNLAIAGHEDGFGKGIFMVGDDYKVSRIDGYQCTPISFSDLDTLIERDENKSDIRVGVFNSRGHGFVIVQGTEWCWVFDTTLSAWHERKSYLLEYCRMIYPIKVFDRWICGDTDASKLLEISANIRKEGGVNDVQTITITGTPTGGTFTLTFDGRVTDDIAHNATATAVQTALEELQPIGEGNVHCTGGPLPGTPVAVRFKDELGVRPLAVMSSTSSLTGGLSPAISIAHTATGEFGDPIRMRVETGPNGAFPQAVRINSIELLLTKGASDATGTDPDETDVEVGISISRDGGQTWSNPRNVKIGRQSLTAGRVRSSIWGQAEVQGVKWRFDESAGVDFAFLGADQLQDVLR